ncbi:MAG: DNA replication/repair protein RecF [Anaerolineae bacterium]|nr:DNA replication/repair protein RecF [Anaerolineae bacterium]
MRLRHLSLTNYRNYTRLELDLPARVNVFEGENAQGKTNLLEVIYYLATTKSPLATSDRELINWNADREPIPFAQVDGAFVCGSEEHVLAVTMVKEVGVNGNTKTTFRRQIRLDGVPRRAMDVIGQLKVVLFLPEDVRLISGPPSGRRRYLDVTLCQIDPRYCRTLSRYNRVISQRNALLKRIRERQAKTQELPYWDQQMAQLGGYVLARRIWAVGQLGCESRHVQEALTSGRELLTLQYDSSSLTETSVADGGTLPTEDDLEERVEGLTQAMMRALAEARREEVARGMTLVGPHRDDLRFSINGVDATTYGSRGQQRTIALALKLAELRLMQRHSGEQPVLLLDDVLSELDRHRAGLLLEALGGTEQVLITTTSLDQFAGGPFGGDFLDSATLWRIADGTVSSLG